MKPGTLAILRCPYCGGRLTLVDQLPHRRDDQDIRDGILGCYCCIFPVVDGIPVLHLQPPAIAVRDHVQAGHFNLARRAMFGFDDEALADAFDAVAASPTATFRETVDALGPNFEGGYFLYRFSDPTFVVADAVVRAVAGAVLGPSTLREPQGRPEHGRGATGSGQAARRAIDICGGSGHLTRTLIEFSSEPPVLANLFFAKVWLARRFTAPGCEPVCCDGNAPMPFARGAFSLAMCTDAFMYIWTKRQFVADMIRLVDETGAVLIGHTHNERTWSTSHGQPLPPEGYADLFETLEPRVFGEAALFADIVDGRSLDLSRRDSQGALDNDPALTIIATTDPRVFVPHPLAAPIMPRGEFRLNPLYAADQAGEKIQLRLRFPSEDYEQEYGACRRYLPDEVTIDRSALDALARGGPLPSELIDLARRKVIVDLPRRYY